MATLIAGYWRFDEPEGRNWRRKRVIGGRSAGWNNKVLNLLGFKSTIFFC
jgi:hypothetical protein